MKAEEGGERKGGSVRRRISDQLRRVPPPTLMMEKYISSAIVKGKIQRKNVFDERNSLN